MTSVFGEMFIKCPLGVDSRIRGFTDFVLENYDCAFSQKT